MSSSIHRASSELGPTASSDSTQVADGIAPGKHFTRAQVLAATQEAQYGTAPRNFGLLSIIGLAYAILNSWTAMAASLSVALPSGGPSAVIWGIVVSLLGTLSMALSLAELTHVYTTSGGPYHFTAILAPSDSAPFWSYLTGWFAVAGWWALTGTTGSLAGQLITGAWAISRPDYEIARYQIYVVYLGYIAIACLLNTYGSRLLPSLNQAAIIWSLAGAAVIAVTCLACSSGDYQPASFVFGEYINETGWNNGVAWILGLLQSAFGLVGVDGVSHMVEEMPNPSVNAPRAMVLAVLVGASSSFVFLICLLFCIRDVNDVIASTQGALIAAIHQATSSNAGTICLSVFPIVSMMFAAQGILCTAARMTQAFARDRGLPFSTYFAKQDERTGIPVRAVYLTTVLVMIYGVLYIASSAALNAILSSSVVFLNISYTIPVALLLARGRSNLLRPASFPAPTMLLPHWLGTTVNVIAVTFTSFTTVFFLFPPEVPATAANMNYAVAVFGLIFLVAAVTWFAKARHVYTGPRDLGALLELARAETNAPHIVRDDQENQAEVLAKKQKGN